MRAELSALKTEVAKLRSDHSTVDEIIAENRRYVWSSGHWCCDPVFTISISKGVLNYARLIG